MAAVHSHLWDSNEFHLLLHVLVVVLVTLVIFHLLAR